MIQPATTSVAKTSVVKPFLRRAAFALVIAAALLCLVGVPLEWLGANQDTRVRVYRRWYVGIAPWVSEGAGPVEHDVQDSSQSWRFLWFVCERLYWDHEKPFQ